jgi:ABC-type phosphate transport system permease subunit
MFIVLDALTLVALAVGGALVLPPLAAVVALAISFPLGLLAGFALADRMPEHVYARSVTVLLLALGVASIVAGVTS